MINMAESLVFAVQELEKAGLKVNVDSLQQIIYISSPIEIKAECFRPGPNGPFAEGIHKILLELKKNGVFKNSEHNPSLKLSKKISLNVRKENCLKDLGKNVELLINNKLAMPKCLSTISQLLMVHSANEDIPPKKLFTLFDEKSRFLGWGKASKVICKKAQKLGLLK